MTAVSYADANPGYRAIRWFAEKAGHGHIVLISASGSDESGKEMYRIGGLASVQTIEFHDRSAKFFRSGRQPCPAKPQSRPRPWESVRRSRPLPRPSSAAARAWLPLPHSSMARPRPIAS